MNGPDGPTLKAIYQIARRINLVDERIRQLIAGGKLKVVYYSAKGQELIPAAISVHLHAQDYLVTTYRGMHDQLAKGVPLKTFFAEYGGRATGSCKGKGGPMHITYPPTGVMVTTGIVGSGIPIANGLALASQVRGDCHVTVCNFGDGATNIGAFHEALNLASLWKLPVVFVCQNNLYAESTRLDEGTAITEIHRRASSYGIPGVRVDGNDASAMWRAAGEAIARARTGDGPTLIEAMTFRLMGHYFGDPSAYIPKDEMRAAAAREPVPLLRARIVEERLATEEELRQHDERTTQEIDEAVAFMNDSPYPDPIEMQRDVFLEEISA